MKKLIDENRLFLAMPPLFKIYDKNKYFYAFDENEKYKIIKKNFKKENFNITRFKGLGEISPDEFKFFIGESMRLDPIRMDKETTIEELLEFYMGKNTPDRQTFIINNLKIEADLIESID